MASHYTYEGRHSARETIAYHGRAVGDADVEANGFGSIQFGGPGVTVARAAEGLIDVTLPFGYPRLLSAVARLNDGGDGVSITYDPSESDIASGVVAFRTRRGGEIREASRAVGFADLTDSDGAQTFAFATALPAGAVIVGSGIDITAGFTDGSTGVFTADLGVNGGDLDSLLDGVDIASIATLATPQGVQPTGLYGAITPAVTVLADVNVDTATAGALTAYVYYVVPGGTDEDADGYTIDFDIVVQNSG